MKVKEKKLKDSSSDNIKHINNNMELQKKSKKGIALIICIVIILVLIILFIIPNKKGSIKISVKSSLDRLVEKSDLETVNITYNVIAKQCKNESDCDIKSNDIEDFKYVVSCKGTITAGIDFKKIKIDINEKDKKLIVTMPEASVTSEPTVGKVKFLNGGEVPSKELPNARVLCLETVKKKSNEDGKLLPAAKEQARAVLQDFYEQWIKAYDSDYTVEVK